MTTTATATTPPTSSSATSGGDDSRRNDGDSDMNSVVVVGCASGLVAWFTLLPTATTTSISSSNCDSVTTGGVGGTGDAGIILVSSKARIWRPFDNVQVRERDPS